jgi:beta-amyrin synthase
MLMGILLNYLVLLNSLCFFFHQMLNPTEFFADIVIEHEYVECTASAIQALVLFMKLYPGHRKKEIENFIKNAAQFLQDIQMLDGSWYVPPLVYEKFVCFYKRCSREMYYMIKHFHRYGNWGVCFTYGTWFALGGLAAAGKTFNNCSAMRRAVDFLLRAQRDNGGWGESYLSCPNKVIMFYHP